MKKYSLEMKNITKSFAKVNVLDEVDFCVKSGEVHALMGGNGAGKSTLMKILTGVYSKDSGDIFIDENFVNLESPNDSNKHGVQMIFQEFSLVSKMTVAQNIFLHKEPKNKWNFIDEKVMKKETKQLLDRLDINLNPSDYVEDLSVGYWQMIEIAKAISYDAKIIIMDEPTSTLSLKETQNLFNIIRNLKKQNITVIYISHRMDEIFEICDKVTVLRNGKNVYSANLSETTMDDIIKNMLGSKMESEFEWTPRKVDYEKPPVLEVNNFETHNIIKDVSFNLYKGEILGFAGLMGSGRSETAKAIFGIDKKKKGVMKINSRVVEIKTPLDAIKNGISLVPEDRREEGLILKHTIKGNIVLPILKKLKKNFLINNRESNRLSEEFVKKLNIKSNSIYDLASSLSGGNQQKVVLAKWLSNKPEILILDEPTSGVDIGAKSEILNIMRELANQGKSIIVISSEITELLAISDRLMIFQNGKIVNSIERNQIKSEEEIEIAIQKI